MFILVRHTAVTNQSPEKNANAWDMMHIDVSKQLRFALAETHNATLTL